MWAFMKWLERRYDTPFTSYEELWSWSVRELEEFWACVWEFCGVRASKPYERVLSGERMPGAKWFEGAELNYAENVLCRERDPTAIAVLHASELRQLQPLTWGELTEQVTATAAGLRALGVGRGDRVVAYMPNIPETLVAFLAVASVGAIWSSAAPEFGAGSVIDRFAQIEPRVLLAVDGYRYGGKDFDRTGVLAQLIEQLPTLEHVVLVPYLSQLAGGTGVAHEATQAPRTLTWGELGRLGDGAAPSYEQVPFGHPLWVLYSSGTTGLPKAIVQGHGGILLEQLKKSYLHLDLRANDRMFWFTTTGWMMWNFLIGCLLSESAIVLYDGNPAHPDLGMLWRLAQRAGVTCFGTSAGFLTSCMKEGLHPADRFNLGSLRSIGSTGSPLPPEGFEWVYQSVKPDVWLFSTSGGTDVCTAFVGGSPILPVYSGELQCRALGCAVEAWDENGNSVTEEVGELVITKPMPSMPLFFWGDEDGARYRESYFSMYPGVWRHGDWIRITQRGGAVIYGRSDSTINRQGVRMGTSEIYRAAATVQQVTDALVVDVPRDGELWMALFVVLKDGVTLDDELRKRIKQAIREQCSPRHVPNEVRQVGQVPRTLSGKILEVPVKKILMGAAPEQAASVDSLADPSALDYFTRLAAELRAEP
jgi:acetoacetyl-CoA synthetase